MKRIADRRETFSSESTSAMPMYGARKIADKTEKNPPPSFGISVKASINAPTAKKNAEKSNTFFFFRIYDTKIAAHIKIRYAIVTAKLPVVAPETDMMLKAETHISKARITEIKNISEIFNFFITIILSEKDIIILAHFEDYFKPFQKYFAPQIDFFIFLIYNLLYKGEKTMIFSKSTINVLDHEAPFREYIPDEVPNAEYNGKRPAVIVLPGGGYGITYAGEAEPIALKFVSEGICAFVLDYAVKDSGRIFPQALLEALTAVKFVRDNAEKYGIDKNNIATLGFSAGGHLCSCTGTLWNKPFLEKYFEDGTLVGSRNDYRPDKMILCYPVISSDKSIAHIGSFENVIGKKYTEISNDMFKLTSTEKQVDSGTPPTFVWATAEDSGVPCQNSIVFSMALADNKVPFELRIYPHGDHGLCTGDYVTNALPFGSEFECAEWSSKAVKFMYDRFKK